MLMNTSTSVQTDTAIKYIKQRAHFWTFKTRMDNHEHFLNLIIEAGPIGLNWYMGFPIPRYSTLK